MYSKHNYQTNNVNEGRIFSEVFQKIFYALQVVQVASGIRERGAHLMNHAIQLCSKKLILLN